MLTELYRRRSDFAIVTCPQNPVQFTGSRTYFYWLQARQTDGGQAGDPSQGSGQWFVETKRLVLLSTAKVVVKETVLKVSKEMRIRNATKEL